MFGLDFSLKCFLEVWKMFVGSLVMGCIVNDTVNIKGFERAKEIKR